MGLISLHINLVISFYKRAAVADCAEQQADVDSLIGGSSAASVRPAGEASDLSL